MEFMLSLLFFHLQFSPTLNNEVLITYEFDWDQSEGVLGTYKCTQEYGFTIGNIPLLKLFEIIKPLHIFEIMKLLLMEKKVLIIKKDARDLSSIIESLLVLLYPFEWTGVNVSYLSYEMAEYIEAPMPYIIGIEQQVWKQLQRDKGKGVDWMPLDVSVYDIEKGGFRCTEKGVPEFPPIILESSYNALLFVTNSIDLATKEQSVLHFKSIFMQFYSQLLNNYKEYFLVDPRSSRDIAQNLFDIEQYISEAPESSKEFLRNFSKTQCFNNFIEHEFSFHKEGIDVWKPKSDGKLTTIKCSLNYAFHLYEQEMDAINNVMVTPRIMKKKSGEQKILSLDKILYLPPLSLKKPKSFLLKKNIYFRTGQNKAHALNQHPNSSLNNRKCAKVEIPPEEKIRMYDPSIAEEFNENEEPIFRDLARRENRKENQMDKISQAMNLLQKRPDLIIKQFERFRSLSHYPPKSKFNCTSVLSSKQMKKIPPTVTNNKSTEVYAANIPTPTIEKPLSCDEIVTTGEKEGTVGKIQNIDLKSHYSPGMRAKLIDNEHLKLISMFDLIKIKTFPKTADSPSLKRGKEFTSQIQNTKIYFKQTDISKLALYANRSKEVNVKVMAPSKVLIIFFLFF